MMAFSGPKVVSFRQGWALPFGGHSKAHYFVRQGVAEVVSLCKRNTGLAGRMFEPGDFPKCGLCVRAIKFHGVPG